MKVIEKPISEIYPYPNNPRKNKKAIAPVVDSIKEFGFNQPIVIDAKGVIIVGHTRYEAGKSLGMEKLPVVVADKLTQQQIDAYRIVDNRTHDFSEWDSEKLLQEIDNLNQDFSANFLGFEIEDIDPQEIEINEWDFTEVNDRFVITITSTQDKQAEITKRLKGIDGVTIEASYFK